MSSVFVSPCPQPSGLGTKPWISAGHALPPKQQAPSGSVSSQGLPGLSQLPGMTVPAKYRKMGDGNARPYGTLLGELWLIGLGMVFECLWMFETHWMECGSKFWILLHWNLTRAGESSQTESRVNAMGRNTRLVVLCLKRSPHFGKKEPTNRSGIARTSHTKLAGSLFKSWKVPLPIAKPNLILQNRSQVERSASTTSVICVVLQELLQCFAAQPCTINALVDTVDTGSQHSPQ